LQLKKFIRLFEFAKYNSVFYRELYKKEGVFNLEIRSADDIKRLPIINKSLLRQSSYEDILTEPPNSTLLNIHSTSGSSGVPYKIFQNKFEDYTAHVRVFRGLQKEGYHPYKRITLVTRYESNDRFQIEQDLGLFSKIQKRLGVFQREIISVFEPVDTIIDKLILKRPDILWSTPSILQIIAHRLQERDLSLDIPVVFFTSETLFSNQRTLLKKVIANRVIDLYGSTECPTMSFSYDDDNLNEVFSNTFYIECINETVEDNKTIANPIITNLINYTMPFIRYDLHDYTEKLDRPDYPTKVIGRVLGRVDDVITLSDGTHLAHHHAHDMFMDFHEVEHWKIVQKGNVIELQLKIKAGFAPPQQVFQKARSIWNKRYPNIPIIIVSVDDYDVDPLTGKVKNLEIHTE